MAKHREVVIPEFGTRLKKAIKDSRMTQQQVAERIGCDRNTVVKWCNDWFYPQGDMLKLICVTLNVSADYLLELSDEVN